MTRAIPEYSKDFSRANSRLIAGDPEAQNLYWLSHGTGPHPDPHFTSLVRRTLQFVITTGQIDLIDAIPASGKVRGLMRLPPPQAVLRLKSLQHLADLPLYAAYSGWLDTIQERAWLYREPAHPTLDRPVTDFAQALKVIDLVK